MKKKITQISGGRGRICHITPFTHYTLIWNGESIRRYGLRPSKTAVCATKFMRKYQSDGRFVIGLIYGYAQSATVSVCVAQKTVRDQNGWSVVRPTRMQSSWTLQQATSQPTTFRPVILNWASRVARCSIRILSFCFFFLILQCVISRGKLQGNDEDYIFF